MKYAELLTGIKQFGEPRTIRKKSHVAFQGEIPRYAHYILDGAVKAYFISGDGIQTIVDIYAKNSLLPVAWLNHTSSTALFYYEALTDVRTIQFKRPDFEAALESSSTMKEDYTRYLADSQTGSLFRMTGLCQPNANFKVCYALYYLVYKYGVELPAGKFMIPIPLTHEIIANFIGQSRENTAKTVKKLSDDGILEYSSKTYTIHTTRLENFLGEDNFREIIS